MTISIPVIREFLPEELQNTTFEDYFDFPDGITATTPIEREFHTTQNIRGFLIRNVKSSSVGGSGLSDKIPFRSGSLARLAFEKALLQYCGKSLKFRITLGGDCVEDCLNSLASVIALGEVRDLQLTIDFQYLPIYDQQIYLEYFDKLATGIRRFTNLGRIEVAYLLNYDRCNHLQDFHNFRPTILHDWAKSVFRSMPAITRYDQVFVQTAPGSLRGRHISNLGFHNAVLLKYERRDNNRWVMLNKGLLKRGESREDAPGYFVEESLDEFASRHNLMTLIEAASTFHC